MTLLKRQLPAYLASDPDVAAILGDRIATSAIDANTRFPYAIVERISNRHARYMGGRSGVAEDTIQIDVHGDKVSEVEQATEAIRTLLDGWRGDMLGLEIQSTALEDEQDTIIEPDADAENPVYVTSMTFNIWHVEG